MRLCQKYPGYNFSGKLDYGGVELGSSRLRRRSFKQELPIGWQLISHIEQAAVAIAEFDPEDGVQNLIQPAQREEADVQIIVGSGLTKLRLDQWEIFCTG